jgi:hypothetical protein
MAEYLLRSFELAPEELSDLKAWCSSLLAIHVCKSWRSKFANILAKQDLEDSAGPLDLRRNQLRRMENEKRLVCTAACRARRKRTPTILRDFHHEHPTLCEPKPRLAVYSGGKRVRWLAWSRLTDLARPHIFKSARYGQGKYQSIFQARRRRCRSSLGVPFIVSSLPLPGACSGPRDKKRQAPIWRTHARARAYADCT